MVSLFDEALEDFVYINKSIVPDGEGGTKTTWTDGAKLKAAAVYPESTITDIADSLTSRMNCWIWTEKNVVLEPMQVIKRAKDGQVFRVLADNKDDETPESANVSMRRAKAEKWSLPVGV